MRKVNLFGFQFGTQTKTKSLVLSLLFFTAFTFDGFGQLGVFSNNTTSTGNAIVEIKKDITRSNNSLPELRFTKTWGTWAMYNWDLAPNSSSGSLNFTPGSWGGQGLVPTLSLNLNGNVGIGIEPSNDPSIEKFMVNGTTKLGGNTSVDGNLKTQSITGSDNRGVFVINNPANTSFPAIEMYNNNSTSRKGSINFVSDATNGSEGAFNFVRYTAPNAWTNSMEIDGGGNMTVYGEFVIRNTDLSKQFKVDRTGAVRARRVQVDLATIPDYVFKPDYKLMPLDDLKTFITKNNHLPNVPSEQEYKERGNIDLSELNLKLLEKVEELTLYVLQQEDKNKALLTQLEAQQKSIEELRALILQNKK